MTLFSMTLESSMSLP